MITMKPIFRHALDQLFRTSTPLLGIRKSNLIFPGGASV